MFNNLPSSLPAPLNLPEVVATTGEGSENPTTVAEAWKTIEAWMNAERKALQDLRDRFDLIKNTPLQKQAVPVSIATAPIFAKPSAKPESNKRKEAPASLDAIPKTKAPSKTPKEPHAILIDNSRTLLKTMIDGRRVHFSLDHKKREAYDSLTHEFYATVRKEVGKIELFLKHNPEHASAAELNEWKYIWRTIGHQVEVTLPTKAVLAEFPDLDEENSPLHALISGFLVAQGSEQKLCVSHPLIALYVRLVYTDNVMSYFKSQIVNLINAFPNWKLGFSLKIGEREVKYIDLTPLQIWLVISQSGKGAQVPPSAYSLQEPSPADTCSALRLEGDKTTIINPFTDYLLSLNLTGNLKDGLFHWGSNIILHLLSERILLELDHPAIKDRLLLLCEVIKRIRHNNGAAPPGYTTNLETLISLFDHYKIENPFIKHPIGISTNANSFYKSFLDKLASFDKPIYTTELISPGHYFKKIPAQKADQKEWQARFEQVRVAYFNWLFNNMDSSADWTEYTMKFPMSLDTLEERYRFFLKFNSHPENEDDDELGGIFYPIPNFIVNGNEVSISPRYSFCENFFHQLLEEKEGCLQQVENVLATYLLSHYPKSQLPLEANGWDHDTLVRKHWLVEEEAFRVFTSIPINWTDDGEGQIKGTMTLSDVITMVRRKESIDALFQRSVQANDKVVADFPMEDTPFTVTSPHAALHNGEDGVEINHTNPYPLTAEQAPAAAAVSLDLFAPHLSVVTPGQPRGLHNFGNTCYINSSIQALLCFKGLKDLFQLKFQPPVNDPKKEPAQNYLDYRELLIDFMKAYQAGTELITFDEKNRPSGGLLYRLRADMISSSLHREFFMNGMGQHDAQGYTTLALDSLFYKFKQTITYSAEVEQETIKRSKDEELGMLIVEFVRANKDEPYKLSEMIRASRVERIVADPNNKWRYLDTKEQKLETDTYTITKTLTDPPPLLIINLNRNAYDRELKRQVKITDPVVLDEAESLDLSAYAEPGKLAKYKLIACVNHTNNKTDFGHYITYGVRGDDHYLFNDENVRKLDADGIAYAKEKIVPETYLLFYQREDV